MATKSGRSSTSRFVESLISGGHAATAASTPPREDPVRDAIPIVQTMARSADNAFARVVELEQKIQQSVDGGRTIIEIDPAGIRRARLTDRADGFTGDETYKELRDSIRKDGQHQPVGVRRLDAVGEDGAQYETCWGHRRIAACRELERPVLAIVLQPDDLRAAVMGYSENARRAGTSFIEQGRFFAALLERGLFVTQQDVAEALQVSKTWVSQAVQAADIPDDILDAIGEWRHSTKRQAMALRKAMDMPDGLHRMRATIGKAATAKGGITGKVAMLVEAAAPAAGPYGVKRRQRDAAGRAFVTLEKDSDGVIYRFAKAVDPQFVEFVWERLPGLHAEFDKKTAGTKGVQSAEEA
jgi:ParB family transcriptional regulator, chromosome partitioning protein